MKTNLNELKKLDLSCNSIWDIRPLEKVKFENLEGLNLKRNPLGKDELFLIIINNLTTKISYLNY